VPAFERYDGPLWQTLRTVDPLGKRAVATFLSAHLGFGAAWHRIETYDARLTPAVAARLIAGGTAMRWPPSKPGRTPIGDYAANTIKHLAQCVTRDLEIERLPFHDVALVGGELYLQVMRAYVAEFRAEGEITARARVTEINGPIGVMRKSLREWLTTRSEMPDMSISASVVHSVRVEGDKRRSFDSRGAALRFACGEVFLSPERLHDVEARLASGRAVSWAYEYSRVHVYPGVS
jgi:hypothetical protein